MALKVRMSANGRVDAIEVDAQPDWIVKYQQANQTKLPSLPNWLLPVINNYTKGQLINQDIEVIPCSGQYWHDLRSDQKAQLLELVEWLGKDVDQYVRDFEIMYPRDPDFHKRRS